MEKKICCYCKDGWEPIETSVGKAHLGVIPGEYWDPPMVNVLMKGRVLLHCTVRREAQKWCITQSNVHYEVDGIEKALPSELASELIEIVTGWAAENPQEFVSQDRESFYDFLATSGKMLEGVLDEAPAYDELAGLLKSRWASLATPASIKATEQALTMLTAAFAAAKEAKALLDAAGKDRIAA